MQSKGLQECNHFDKDWGCLVRASGLGLSSGMAPLGTCSLEMGHGGSSWDLLAPCARSVVADGSIDLWDRQRTDS